MEPRRTQELQRHSATRRLGRGDGERAIGASKEISKAGFGERQKVICP